MASEDCSLPRWPPGSVSLLQRTSHPWYLRCICEPDGVYGQGTTIWDSSEQQHVNNSENNSGFEKDVMSDELIIDVFFIRLHRHTWEKKIQVPLTGIEPENDVLISKWHRHTRKKILVLLSGVKPKTLQLLVRMLYH